MIGVDDRPGPLRKAPGGRRGWPVVLAVVVLLSAAGWTYLLSMLADMVPVMDMSQAGPGMGVFNRFNLFDGLSAEARAALAVVCLPTGATFGMPGIDMTLADLGKVFLMWAMMALAMMLPSALPMLRAYAAETGLGTRSRLGAALPVLMAAFGYLTVWMGYAAVATAAQWALTALGSLNGMLAPASLALTTSVLFAAGLYQFLPAKRACLQRCWYPRFHFGAGGPATGLPADFREGLSQGLVCLGCCWAVMTVMFAVGLMNILWIALLGGVMALEKTFPNRVLPIAIGIFLVGWSAFLAAAVLFPGLSA